jgi:hypothetical protein
MSRPVCLWAKYRNFVEMVTLHVSYRYTWTIKIKFIYGEMSCPTLCLLLQKSRVVLCYLKTLYSLQSFFNVEFYDRIISCVKTEMIWEEWTLGYFGALHWRSPKGLKKMMLEHVTATILQP